MSSFENGFGLESEAFGWQATRVDSQPGAEAIEKQWLELLDNVQSQPNFLQATHSQQRRRLAEVWQLPENHLERIPIVNLETAKAVPRIIEFFASSHFYLSRLPFDEAIGDVIDGEQTYTQTLVNGLVDTNIPAFELKRRQLELRNWLFVLADPAKNQWGFSPCPSGARSELEQCAYKPEIGLWKIRTCSKNGVLELALEGSDPELQAQLLAQVGVGLPENFDTDDILAAAFMLHQDVDPIETLFFLADRYDALLSNRYGGAFVLGKKVDKGTDRLYHVELTKSKMKQIDREAERLGQELVAYKAGLGAAEIAGRISIEEADHLEKEKIKALVAELRKIDPEQARVVLGETSFRNLEKYDQFMLSGDHIAAEIAFLEAMDSMNQLRGCGESIGSGYTPYPSEFLTGNPHDIWGGIKRENTSCKNCHTLTTTGRDYWCRDCARACMK